MTPMTTECIAYWLLVESDIHHCCPSITPGVTPLLAAPVPAGLPSPGGHQLVCSGQGPHKRDPGRLPET